MNSIAIADPEVVISSTVVGIQRISAAIVAVVAAAVPQGGWSEAAQGQAEDGLADARADLPAVAVDQSKALPQRQGTVYEAVAVYALAAALVFVVEVVVTITITVTVTVVVAGGEGAEVAETGRFWNLTIVVQEVTRGCRSMNHSGSGSNDSVAARLIVTIVTTFLLSDGLFLFLLSPTTCSNRRCYGRSHCWRRNSRSTQATHLTRDVQRGHSAVDGRQTEHHAEGSVPQSLALHPLLVREVLRQRHRAAARAVQHHRTAVLGGYIGV